MKRPDRPIQLRLIAYLGDHGTGWRQRLERPQKIVIALSAPRVLGPMLHLEVTVTDEKTTLADWKREWWVMRHVWRDILKRRGQPPFNATLRKVES